MRTAAKLLSRWLTLAYVTFTLTRLEKQYATKDEIGTIRLGLYSLITIGRLLGEIFHAQVTETTVHAISVSE